MSILCTCCSHFSWYCFISFTILCAFFLIHWFFSLSNFVIPSKCLKNFICAASKRCSSLFSSTQCICIHLIVTFYPILHLIMSLRMDNCCVRSIKGNKNYKRNEQNSRKQKKRLRNTTTIASRITIEYHSMGMTRRSIRSFGRIHKCRDTRPSKEDINSQTSPNPRQSQSPKIHKLKTMINQKTRQKLQNPE